MAQLKNIKLTARDGSPIDDEALSQDFRAAEKLGPFWVGEKNFFYRSGLKKICIPFSDIDRAFTRVQEVNTHCCCGGYCMYTYRLVLCKNGEEIASVYTDEDENWINKAQALFKERIPGVEIGYVKPEDKKESR